MIQTDEVLYSAIIFLAYGILMIIADIDSFTMVFGSTFFVSVTIPTVNAIIKFEEQYEY